MVLILYCVVFACGFVLCLLIWVCVVAIIIWVRYCWLLGVLTGFEMVWVWWFT